MKFYIRFSHLYCHQNVYEAMHTAELNFFASFCLWQQVLPELLKIIQKRCYKQRFSCHFHYFSIENCTKSCIELNETFVYVFTFGQHVFLKFGNILLEKDNVIAVCEKFLRFFPVLLYNGDSCTVELTFHKWLMYLKITKILFILINIAIKINLSLLCLIG